MKFNEAWKSPLLNLVAKAGDSLTTYVALTSYPDFIHERNPIGATLIKEIGLLEALLFSSIGHMGITLLVSLYIYKGAVKEDGESTAKKYYNTLNLFGASIAGLAALLNVNTILNV